MQVSRVMRVSCGIRELLLVLRSIVDEIALFNSQVLVRGSAEQVNRQGARPFFGELLTIDGISSGGPASRVNGPRESSCRSASSRHRQPGGSSSLGAAAHYDFCDTTTAYNLAIGAAFISESCSALALRRNGDVDFDATNRARVERLKTGTVPVQNLREAVWMMLFRGEAEVVHSINNLAENQSLNAD
jgi:hypothetical protein